MGTVIVYVHGLWQRGAEALMLRQRLARAAGAEVRAFSYPSVAADASANARSLFSFLSRIHADNLHLVGHSLGGLMILKLFEDTAEAQARLPPGRIVLLGSPVRGSRTARNLARLKLGRQIMGRSVAQELLQARERAWGGTRDLGVIAGNSGFGLGRLVGTLGAPSDGTVTIEETQIDGAADRIVIRTSHTGMLFSAAVAAQAGIFLNTGRFCR
jgi:pimeloyl-ACP methyl ester carboxylesterase